MSLNKTDLLNNMCSLITATPSPCACVFVSGVVSKPTHQVEEEERLGAELHAGEPRGAEWRGLRERGGGRGVQQAPGPGL